MYINNRMVEFYVFQFQLQLESLDGLSDSALLIVVCVMASMLTQIASNAATANIIVPILIVLSNKVSVYKHLTACNGSIHNMINIRSMIIGVDRLTEIP